MIAPMIEGADSGVVPPVAVAVPPKRAPMPTFSSHPVISLGICPQSRSYHTAFPGDLCGTHQSRSSETDSSKHCANITLSALKKRHTSYAYRYPNISTEYVSPYSKSFTSARYRRPKEVRLRVKLHRKDDFTNMHRIDALRVYFKWLSAPRYGDENE